MRLFEALDLVHAKVRRNPLAQQFTAITRCLLAIGFLYPGLIKVVGMKFGGGLDPATPVGAFFDAFYRTGAWYTFVGWAQVVAAVLLLIPRTASIGAVIYLPIILNIFVLTSSMDFRGTPFITALMLLGSVHLVCWDYDRWRALVVPQPASGSFGRRVYAGYPAAGVLLSVAGLAALAALRIGNVDRMTPGAGVIVAGFAAGFGLVCAWHVRHT